MKSLFKRKKKRNTLEFLAYFIFYRRGELQSPVISYFRNIHIFISRNNKLENSPPALFQDYMEMRSHPRNTRVPYQEELRQLFSTLKINARKFQREPKAWFYAKFLGQEYGFTPLSKHFLSQFQPRELLSYLHTGYQVNQWCFDNVRCLIRK